MVYGILGGESTWRRLQERLRRHRCATFRGTVYVSRLRLQAEN